MRELYWLGIRESDIADTNGIFAGSATIFGTGSSNCRVMEREFRRRIDHNGECPGYDRFMLCSMQQILSEHPEARFVAYDPQDYAGFPDSLQNRFVCQNSYELLHRLNSKFYQKQTLKQRVPVLPYATLSSGEYSSEAVRKLFPKAQRLVVQRDFSCGGSGTFLLDIEQDTFFPSVIPPEEPCIVTAFEEHSISVNIHCVLYTDDFLLFAPSVQIIRQDSPKLEYIGSDYSSFQTLSVAEQEQVRKLAVAVCRYLQAEGYLGVCGIDMLLSGGECYFMELNPRFQASSALLNRTLIRESFPSLQKYHLDAFFHASCTLRHPPCCASGSMLVFHFHEESARRLRWLWKAAKQSESFILCDDGLCWEQEMEDGCYAFQIQSTDAMSCVTFQHTLRLHPNLSLSQFDVSNALSYDNLLKLKLLLLARGVSITEVAWCAAQRSGGVDWEEFCAVTLKLGRDIWITSPCMEKWQELSPLQIDAESDNGRFFVRYYGERLMSVEIMPEDPLGSKVTQRGTLYRNIAYLNPDRLRIYHRDGCVLQDCGKGCQFCDLFGTGKSISFDEICEVLDAYRDETRVSHYLIGGGSDRPEAEYQSILRIATYLHTQSNKHIYVMSQPIAGPTLLQKLALSGVTEVAFNVEMFDAQIAAMTMPGKSRHSVEHYMECLRDAVAIFGSNGEVRCAVLVGFDEIGQFKDGIRRICETGASPMLSLFRPASGTPLANYMPLNETDAFIFYQSAKDICDEFSVRLGPSCRACQNNVIVLDADQN